MIAIASNISYVEEGATVYNNSTEKLFNKLLEKGQENTHERDLIKTLNMLYYLQMSS